MNDIQDKEDVKIFVDSFYLKAKADPMIGVVFASRITNDNWQPHLEKMYSFWNTVLFAVQDYRGNPFEKHIPLSIEKKHFDRWISLFVETITENFDGEKADEVKIRATKMGALFQSKLEYLNAQKI